MLDELLRRHDGVITLRQARRIGLGQDAVERRVRSGHWRRCAPGVYFVDDRPFTDAARIRAAVWGNGERAVASGLAAAWWTELTQFAPAMVEVTVPRVSNHISREGIRLRRRDLLPADVCECRGLRVTTLALTVVEAAARRGGGPKAPGSCAPAADQSDGFVECAPTEQGPARLTGRTPNADGCRRRHPVASRATVGDGSCGTAKITGWRTNRPVAGFEVDVLFRDAKVVIEVDGFAFHSDAEVFQRDRKRQNAIALAGYQVLRFTWLDLVEYPERVIAEIRRAVCAP